MWVFRLLDLTFSTWLLWVPAAVIAALAYPLVVAVRERKSTPTAERDAGVSPLWLLVPFSALVITSPVGLSIPGVEPVWRVLILMPFFVWPLLQLGLFVWQIKLSIGIRRHRHRWPFTVVPFTILLGVLDLPIVLSDLAVILVGPLVRS